MGPNNEGKGIRTRCPLSRRSRSLGSAAAIERGGLETIVTLRGDRGFESLYPSKRLLAGRHSRLAEPGRPTGSSLRILCFEHLEGTCAPAGRPRRKSRGRLRLERQYRD